MHTSSHADLASMLNVLRDPAGIPAPPAIFQWLMVLTWAMHILFVNLVLGGATLAIASFYRRADPLWGRLSRAMTQVTKIALSLAIVLGVAPLLFTQVIYDPMWYASNVLSAAWVMGFIYALGLGYTCWFIFSFRNKEGASSGELVWAVAAVLLFALNGFVMHVLSVQSILPAKWLEWYAPQGVPDMSGLKVHAFSFPRFAFFFAAAVAGTGIFLLAYADYFRTRNDFPPSYRELCRRIGWQWARWGFLGQAVFALVWFAGIEKAGAHPFLWVVVITLLGSLAFLWRRSAPAAAGKGYLFQGLFVVYTLIVGIAREEIRLGALLPLGYDPMTYKVNLDLASTLLFFTTFLGVGGLALGFLLAMLWQAGRVEGSYVAGKTVARLSNAALAIVLIWISIFFAVGISVWIRNFR
ncbi:hypothetical protein MAMC_00892 [Methylacidimicrobium cyclopophantes]|uniref:Uncharacterized protein n=1 Tax=Methylacidimicrobium cyclopophantes TaxID=1041766 RepID=A0A5E6MCB0_9BACT|nr:hypothetical protein [Methylacidimicrobium cyclopophantes]VVM05965.1 hypothetical protein MAMC_00892 [Methylacidimicrobium cyclopophantes]